MNGVLRLTQFSLRYPLLTLLLALALSGLGVRALMNLPIDAFPDVSSPQVKIVIKAAGMTPEEVESRITAPVEVELLGLPKQTMLRSTSKYGLADITLDFEDGTDVYWARTQVSERLNGVWSDLPRGISGGVAPMTTPLGEMYMFTVEGDLPLAERRSLLDWTIRPALRTVPGVADVNVLGGLASAYEVMPDPARMSARHVTLEDLSSALSANNRNDGAGRLIDGEESLLVRVEGQLRTLDDVRALMVRQDGGATVRIGDVAEVRLGALTRYGGVTRQGQGETVQGLVLGLRGANAKQVVEGVKARLGELAGTLPPGVHIVPFYDRGELVQRAVHTVGKALIEAVLLVLVLLVLFLGNARAAIAVAVTLPLSALFTFLLMHGYGLTANLMSLGGLAIAIGMLVDAAVVVVENMVNHWGHLDPKHGDRDEAVLQSVREVAMPVVSGVAIIALVFLPLLTLQGLEGKLFSPVALTIVFALSASLLLSLTLIPLLTRYLLKPGRHADPWLPRTLARLYMPALNRAMEHHRWVVGAALVLLLAAGLTYTRLGKIFLPTMDEGSQIVQLEKLPSINLDTSLATDSRFQKRLLEQVPEIERVVARAGTDEIGLDPMSPNQTDTFLSFKPADSWRFDSKEGLQDAIREVLKEFPGLSFAFTQPIEMRVSEMILGARGDLAVRIFGPKLEVLNQKAEEIAGVLRAIPGSEDVYYQRNEGVQYLRVVPDRLALGRTGLSIDALEQLLRAAVEGERMGTIYQEGRRLALIMRGTETLRSTPALLSALPLRLPDGGIVTLGQLATLERVSGPVQILRERGMRNLVVLSNVRGRDLVGFVEQAQREIAAQVQLPTGYRLTFGGEFENQQRAAARLSVVVPVALALIFLILHATFGSVKQAVLVLINIPFALIGGVFALGVSGEYMSVPASVGFIALLGIAVLNGVVLVSHFNELRATGMPIGEAVCQGALRRLRPVAMTASMTAFGLVPLLFASGPGSEIQRPLAIVVIGGLISSTLLTLFLLPILYRRFGDAHEPAPARGATAVQSAGRPADSAA